MRPARVDYNVVMTHPLSIRFKQPGVVELLKAQAAQRGESASSLAEELIDEGLRSRRHPLVGFRDGAGGRRAGLVGGPDIWEVVTGAVGGDVPGRERAARLVELFGLQPQQVDAALAYYAEFTEEVDAQIAANATAAAEAEQRWRRRQDLLAG